MFNFSIGLAMAVFGHCSNKTIQAEPGTGVYKIWLGVLAVDVAVWLYLLPSTLLNMRVLLTGKTQIEILEGLYDDRIEDGSKKNDQEELTENYIDQLAEFLQAVRISRVHENLFIIFGTWNYFKAFFVPTERTLPLRGLEWSFLEGVPGTNSGIELHKANRKQEDDAELIL